MLSRIKPLFGIAGLLSLGIAPPWLAHARPSFVNRPDDKARLARIDDFPQ